MSPTYILDEDAITRRHMLKQMLPPLRVFDVAAFGIDRERFLADMRPTFSILHLDPYDAKRAKVEFLKKHFPRMENFLNGFLADYYAGTSDLDKVFGLIKDLSDADRNEFDRIGMTGRRKRSVARFGMAYASEHAWYMERLPAERYQQKVAPDDPRALVRIFHEMENHVVDHPDILKLMHGLASMVREIDPTATNLEMNVHQMFIYADMMGSGHNAPEGIHQDGADYIVSALVIERAGITGGESVVYGPDKKTEYLRTTLQPGQGIFQADAGSVLWHYVTPIVEDPAVPPDYGSRSILGFDIKVIR